jgi:phage terminase large subunit-like protein
MEALTGISPREAVQLGATSLTMYGRLFFPKTFRQGSPKFHEDIGRALYNPENRQVAVEVFRDGAKTTLLRTFTSQRIAYGISRTILFISASQGHSILSLRWIKRQVEHNKLWASTFRLRKGAKWTDEVVEIWNDTIDAPITLMALGITGQLRGFNIDDHRPDLIICDDTSTDEMTSTAEQRKKYDELFFGALINSLAPRSECPEAKAVLLDTPKSKFDLIESCMADSAWTGLRFGIFDAHGESRWPDRYPTHELRKVKEDYTRTGRLPVWMREKECKIIAEELAAFRQDNLLYWDTVPERLSVILAIDPAISDSKDADDNVVVALGFYKSDVYILDYVAATGQTPEMVTKTVFEFTRKYRPMALVVESIGYQRVLAWFLEKAMREQRVFLPVHQVQDKRRKADRIIQALGGLSGYGKLKCLPSHAKFIEQFTEYSPSYGGHDDVLDAIALGVTWAEQRGVSDWIEGEAIEVDEDLPKLNFRAAP